MIFFKGALYLAGDSEGRSHWVGEMSILASVIGSVLVVVGACGELLPR